jgi:GNAT superfamily N-acetyltransferase
LSSPVRIRDAEPEDVELIFSLIAQLAEYERAPEKVTGTVELLWRALFGPHPSAEALIAEVDGAPAGFALFHGTFSTWECRPGIWLEDLYVGESHRRSGVGKALLAHLAALTLERECARLEWTVLTWNASALDFYEQLGAEAMHEWRTHRLDGEALTRVARGGR